MSKYGDDHECTCEMNLVSAQNKFHADKCELWNEPTFKDGTDEWDGDLGCLVLAISPWHSPEEYIWDGDSPVCKVAQGETVTGIELIGALEQEVLDALTAGTAEADATGLIDLGAGNYADFDARVTYRKIIGDDGAPTWVEELWDAPINITLEEAEASLPLLACQCVPARTFYCQVCGLQRETEDTPWFKWDGKTTYNATRFTGTTPGKNSGAWTYRDCYHAFDTFALPKRQHRNIKISGKRMHGVGTTPDFGLYAYAGWSPSCIATFIPWQDYGLPTVGYVSAAEAIVHAWKLSCDGNIVEVGCMGGHGRTGTILACMAVLSDPEMSPRAAISWVRSVHCKEAIETNSQEWFVAWFRAWYLGETPPPMPTVYTSKHSAHWGAAKTAATAVKAGQCAVHGASCGGYYTTCQTSEVPSLPLVQTFHAGGSSPLTFDTTLYSSGTANSRRRNAKRANRRKARQMTKIGD